MSQHISLILPAIFCNVLFEVEQRMKRKLKIGIIGDFNPDYPSHIATNEALLHAAGALSLEVEHFWLPTEPLEKKSSEVSIRLRRSDAVWFSPGSPYRSITGALQGIQFAREEGRPFIGT